jgi:hypothetical protein
MGELGNCGMIDITHERSVEDPLGHDGILSVVPVPGHPAQEEHPANGQHGNKRRYLEQRSTSVVLTVLVTTSSCSTEGDRCQ